MLDVCGVSAAYDGAIVLDRVSLTVGKGEIVALVGANGAGKTTLLKAISGLVSAAAGTMRIDGRTIDSLTCVERVKLGLAHVPEGRQIFGALSVRENLELGSYAQAGSLSKSAGKNRLAEILAIFPILGERLSLAAGSLSGGQQQMLAIGRGLMSAPKLLLLDEPSLGLSPLLVTEIFATIRSLRARGVSILLCEQNARLSLATADRGYLIETGKIVREGTGAELGASSDILERYLGGSSSQSNQNRQANHRELASRLQELISPR